jgi:hypothetical protein
MGLVKAPKARKVKRYVEMAGIKEQTGLTSQGRKSCLVGVL